MRRHIKEITSHPLVSGSVIVFGGSFFINGLNYLFNLLMGRFLSVSDYGILISLISFIVLLTVFQTALANLFTKFAAAFSARREKEMELAFISYGFKTSMLIAAAFVVFLLLIFIPLSAFLKISITNPFFLLLTFMSICLSLLFAFPVGIFQGQLKFLKLTLINILGAASKIIFGLVFILSGFGVLGGLLAVTFSFFIPYVVSMSFFAGAIVKAKKTASLPFFEDFKKTSMPFLLASFAVTILQSTDVIFARHFLSPIDAGKFAALSLMGKAIFYITSPIYMVFFPVIIHKKEKHENTKSTLFLAGGIIFLCNMFFAGIYTLFPGFIIKLFFPSAVYQSLSPVLGLYSLFISVLSVAFLLHNYFLSIGKTNIYRINWVAALLFIGLVVFLHDSIFHLVLSLLLSSLLLLVLLFVYYFRNESH